MKELELAKPFDDGLSIPIVGEHSRTKHYFLQRYIHAFTTAMRNKGWSSLCYLDLFAGAGLERLVDSNTLSWGSALIAAQAQPPFDRLLLCEIDDAKCAALEQRVKRFRGIDVDHFERGDANEKVASLTSRIPAKALSLAFLDPYGLHLWYETVANLSRHRCDLVIYFADRLDALRNRDINYREDPTSNLDRFLGPDIDWRTLTAGVGGEQFLAHIRKLYVSQLKRLGFKFFEFERINAKGVPIYQLIFCSKHKLGADIWRRVAKKKPDGQYHMDFGNPEE